MMYHKIVTALPIYIYPGQVKWRCTSTVHCAHGSLDGLQWYELHEEKAVSPLTQIFGRMLEGEKLTRGTAYSVNGGP